MVICMYALNELNSFDPGNELFDIFSEDLSFGFNEFYQIAFENEHGKHARKSSKNDEILVFWLESVSHEHQNGTETALK